MENLKIKDSFLKDKQIVLGLSGGVDSVVLLHYLHTHYANNLRVVHCNHHLSKHCNEWATFCKNLCAALNINYTNIDIKLLKKSNIEENARKSRYNALSRNLLKYEVLCTAHHKNDQAETLLLQLFRGCGVAGLAAMPKLKPFGKGVHYRPMLNIGKIALLKYAQDNHLSWVEDGSNTNTNFRRNFLRLNIVPKLETVYKNLTTTLLRSARHQSEALQLIQDLAKIDIAKNQLISGEQLNIKPLMQLHPYRIKNIIRYHLKSLNFALPSDKIMQQILDLLFAKQDANPLVNWGAFEVRRYKNKIYFLDTQATKNQDFCPYYEEFKDIEHFSIRYRTKGQRIRIHGKQHSQSLKKVLQEVGIPPWKRNTLRMYYIQDELRAMECIGYMQNDK